MTLIPGTRAFIRADVADRLLGIYATTLGSVRVAFKTDGKRRTRIVLPDPESSFEIPADGFGLEEALSLADAMLQERS